MFKRAFQHRSGRVISLSRFVLALVFFLAVWIDPSQPARHGNWAYPLLFLYVVASGALLLLAWNNWWVDYKSSRPAHVVDVAIFSASVFVTEAYSSAFTSPFFTFFTFLLFSAIVRWGWRAALISSAVATALYVLIGLLGLHWGAPDFDPYRFGRRATYLVLLSLVLVWFGVNQELATLRRQPGDMEIDPQADEPPIKAALAYAQKRTDADCALMTWWSKEEPWFNITSRTQDGIVQDRFGPTEAGDLVLNDFGEEPFLFDLMRKRALVSVPGDGAALLAIAPQIEPRLAEQLRNNTGLCIPFRAIDYEGRLFLSGVPGLCCEDLRIGKAIGDEIAIALDRFSIMNIAEQSAVNETRLSIARDLHDSVAQVLAGACFRLEALRSWVKAGRDPDPEIVAVKEALRGEQQNIRSLITRLRIGGESSRIVNVIEGLDQISGELARQWNIECCFEPAQGELEAPGWLLHELRQIVREGSANAVRHGNSQSVSLELNWTQDSICLVISGRASKPLPLLEWKEAPNNQKLRPWSVHERVNNLGGSLSLSTSDVASKLTIVLPREKEE